MSHRRGACGLLALVFASVGGCSAADGTKTGNGMRMEFGSTTQGLVAADAGAWSDSGASGSLQVRDQAGLRFRLDEARLALGKIELRARAFDPCPIAGEFGDSTCKANRFTLREDIVVNLLARTSVPSLLGLEFPSGVYDRIEVRIEPLDTSAPRDKASFWVKGALLEGPGELPFALSLKRSQTLRFEDAGGVDVEGGHWLTAQLDMGLLFAALPISSCLLEGKLEVVDGVQLIDDQSGCSDIERALVDELRGVTRLNRR